MQLFYCIPVLLGLLHGEHTHDENCLCAISPAVFELYDSITPILEPDGAAVPVATPPVYNSLPGAAAHLYLDFNGHLEAQWGPYQNVSTPVFDLDANPATFNDSEQAVIKEIFERVSEDYALFNINVTTVEPPSFADKVALRVAIGGSGTWYGNAGGVAYRNSFTSSSYTNTVHVFPGKLANNTKYIAEASSHEAGHAFGLAHQSRYTTTGTLQDSYHPGGGGWAPVMGLAYYQARSTWWNGTTISATTLQDDISIIGNTTNGFGLKADDHGDTAATAKPLNVSGLNLSQSGMIGTITDKDYFSFTTGSGTVTLAANVATIGGNLDSKLELRDSSDTLIATASPTDSLSSSITTTLTRGNYYVVVSSTNRYGDLGRYTVSGKTAVAQRLVMSKTQKVKLSIAPKSRAGNPATLDNKPVWTSTNPAILALQVATDGLSATALTTGQTGQITVKVTVDAKIGSGVRLLSGVLDIDILDAPANIETVKELNLR